MYPQSESAEAGSTRMDEVSDQAEAALARLLAPERSAPVVQPAAADSQMQQYLSGQAAGYGLHISPRLSYS